MIQANEQAIRQVVEEFGLQPGFIADFYFGLLAFAWVNIRRLRRGPG